ncbi:MAG: hypothetical protein AB1505_21150 [Candidatus Latescibacterota bacterium]
MSGDTAQLRLLKADIEADLVTVAALHGRLTGYDAEALEQALLGEERRIAVAYYLHNLYCAYESIFQRIAEVFGNQVAERSGWHAGLLRRMALDVPGMRPRLLSDQSWDNLDELRRFRHLFRSAYRLQLAGDRLALVLRRAHLLTQSYRSDFDGFLNFLDGMLSAAGE